MALWPMAGQETLSLPDTEVKCVEQTVVPKDSPPLSERRIGWMESEVPTGLGQGEQKHQFATVGHPSSTP